VISNNAIPQCHDQTVYLLMYLVSMCLGILFSGVFITDSYMFVMDLLSVTTCFGSQVFYICFLEKMFCVL
jgi:hypothetical protein